MKHTIINLMNGHQDHVEVWEESPATTQLWELGLLLDNDPEAPLYGE